MQSRRTVRVVVVVISLVIAALGPLLPTASGETDPWASTTGDGVDIVVELLDGDAVVFGPRTQRPTAAKGTGGGSNARVVHDGFATFGHPSLLERYEVRLVSSTGIDRVRPFVAGAVRDAGAVGPTLALRSGSVDRMGPARGQIDVVVSDSGPCRGSWLACGGPTVVDGVVHSGRIWVSPRLLSRTSHEIANTVRHEFGHTMGLAHYDWTHEGAVQVMHSTRFDALHYQAGDLRGIAYNLHGPAPSVTIDGLGYAAGRLEARGSLRGVPPGGRLRIATGGRTAMRPITGERYFDGIEVGAGHHRVCVAIEHEGSVSGETCAAHTAPATPFGLLESVTTGAFWIRAAGWAIDPQTADPIRVDLVVGRTAHFATADRPRPDVAATHPAYGERHGFRITRYALPGTREVCVVARDVGGSRDRTLGCRTVQVGGVR